jgi:hypothetical protein
MRTSIVACLVLALAVPALAGDAPASAPKPELDRPSTKPKDAPPVCGLVDRDPNAPSDRTDCIATRDPAPQRPVEKTPPAGPGNDAVGALAQ